jgi:hypothetical protein
MVINVHNAMRKTKKASKHQLMLLVPGIPCLLPPKRKLPL